MKENSNAQATMGKPNSSPFITTN
ncbi:hypothetical protein D027_1776A, partial [Vibrio parahaemolyticus 861]